MSNHWYDFALHPVGQGDMVLDERGDCWVVTDRGGYGPENYAICDGVGYTTGERALGVGFTFKIASTANENACPEHRAAGKELYQRWASRQTRTGKELRERRRHRMG